MPSQIPIGGLDRLLDTFFALIVVCLLAAVAIWFARLACAPHRLLEFSELSAAQIQRRRAVYSLVRWCSAIAVLTALLMFVRACAS